MPSPTHDNPSRYRRVKQILDQAAGSSQANYQGFGRFWHLPLPQLLELTVYGVRMIAPAARGASPVTAAPPSVSSPASPPVGGCCHAPKAPSPPSPPPAAQPNVDSSTHCLPSIPGRGAASGLVRGLKGEPPFDGTQFPRLPWGGQPVSAGDIRFIESWIDDGCPDSADSADSHGATGVECGDDSLAALHRGDAEHPPSGGVVNAFHDQGGTLKIRKNVEWLSVEELDRFRKAVQRMKSLDAYAQDERSFGFWGRLHGNLCQHGWEEFLTWHRAYLYSFEQQLQDIDPTVTLPYWDWTLYDQDWQVKEVDSGSIPKAYECWLDGAAIDALAGRIPGDWVDKLRSVTDQTFGSANRLFRAAGLPYASLLDPTTLKPVPDGSPTHLVLDALARVNPLWHRLRWPGPNNFSGDVSPIFESYPKPDDIARILKLDDFFQFGSGPDTNHFFGAVETVHNVMHNFAGGINPVWEATPAFQTQGAAYDPQNRWEPQYGDMVSAGVTAVDPIFWAHHSNVDRLWAEWQKLHPGAKPDNPDASLPPWSLTVADTFSTAALGYEYVQSAHLFETNPAVPFTRFRSSKAGIHPRVLARHRRAEIRIHRVKFSIHGGGFIRVFLNLPDADNTTPIRNNPHYVGQFALFSGYCVGGPGHCEPPTGEPRKFDRRHRHHKTPGNFRIDATGTVRALRALGETDLHVHLVVLDLNGRPKSNALWMSAVSLVFLD
ncbi:MAG: tyrosinase family protein [Limisphaerales bacterium]